MLVSDIACQPARDLAELRQQSLGKTLAKPWQQKVLDLGLRATAKQRWESRVAVDRGCGGLDTAFHGLAHNHPINVEGHKTSSSTLNSIS